MSMSIVLASKSPRRRELLESLGWDFVIEEPYIEEKAAPGEAPDVMVSRLACEKAREVFCRSPRCWVIGADTAVVAGCAVLGKPYDREDAVSMLKMLQGRKHTVMTGVALFAPDGRSDVACEKTDVTFRKLSDEEIDAYIACGESMDKAGAYAIQGAGSLLVERIEGCYFNVVGLPLERLSEMFSAFGRPLLKQWGNCR